MSGRDHSCEMCGRGGMNERGWGETPASPCPACGAPSCGHTDSCACTECCLRRALERAQWELAETQALEMAHEGACVRLKAEVERLTRQNENLKPVSPAVALNNIAKALGEPLQCGHPLVCWDETKGRCDWCQDKADLAAAQRVVEAAKAYAASIAARAEHLARQPHEDSMILMSDAVDDRRLMLDAILCGEGPK
jgi:hypothetical protein